MITKVTSVRAFKKAFKELTDKQLEKKIDLARKQISFCVPGQNDIAMQNLVNMENAAILVRLSNF